MALSHWLLPSVWRRSSCGEKKTDECWVFWNLILRLLPLVCETLGKSYNSLGSKVFLSTMRSVKKLAMKCHMKHILRLFQLKFFCVCVCVCTPSRLTLCHPMDYIAHQAPLSMEFSRQEYWSGVVISSCRGSYQTRDQTHISSVSCIGRRILYHWAEGY